MNSIPCIYKMDFSGNEIWRNQPSNEYSPLQENDHITQAPDGGFVCCSVRYESTPATTAIPTTNEYYRLWLWKVDANGELLWERKYAYITLEEDTNFLIYNYPHDMKTTPDGGYILAGEATVLCTNYPACSEFTQQGWLLKVDGCGCLVPGCDENFTTDVVEKSDVRKYIKVGPNPATDYINIYLGSTPQHEVLWLNIHSTDGKLIKRIALKNEDTTYMLDTTLLSSGNYIITLQDNVSVLQTEKVVVR
jgi:Secretion system C-terminal sorting domain